MLIRSAPWHLVVWRRPANYELSLSLPCQGECRHVCCCWLHPGAFRTGCSVLKKPTAPSGSLDPEHLHFWLGHTLGAGCHGPANDDKYAAACRSQSSQAVEEGPQTTSPQRWLSLCTPVRTQGWAAVTSVPVSLKGSQSRGAGRRLASPEFRFCVVRNTSHLKAGVCSKEKLQAAESSPPAGACV